MALSHKIFSNGVELSDAELASLPSDVMVAWLDMWREARDPELEWEFNAFASEREVDSEPYDTRCRPDCEVCI